ncbi:MAG: hypothetical protein AAGF12_14420 [Myxococcota bacterium]
MKHLYFRRALVLGAAVIAVIGGISWALGSVSPNHADARPPGASAFCDVYADAPVCTSGSVECALCHTTPPGRNAYGDQIQMFLAPDLPRPLDDAQFEAALPSALAMVADLDADGDGATNAQELTAGTIPSDADSVPSDLDCESIDPGDGRLRYDVCGYDERYVYRKLMLDTCGRSPTPNEMEELAAADDSAVFLGDALDGCLASEYWQGRDGVLWNMANKKIGPIAAIKAGEGAGDIPLADYFDDYNLFVWTQSGGRDARELLTARYLVDREDGEQTVFMRAERGLAGDIGQRGVDVAQLVDSDKRAGMLTTRWFLMANTMFTAIPRTTAAQAYRSYLGYDLSLLEGLQPVAGEPVDYDNRGVQAAECAVCHSTLDPLTYPFSRYEGIGGGESPFPATYAPNRLEGFTRVEGEQVTATPERGVLFGQEVQNVQEWAEVAANSDAFAQALVGDYWELFLGEPPRPDEEAEFQALWQALKNEHNHSVNAMLHDLIRTEAYGVP